MNSNYYIIDRTGELLTEEGQTEREAYKTMSYFHLEQGMRGLQVVRREELSAENQAKLKDFEDRVAELTAQMRGRRVA